MKWGGEGRGMKKSESRYFRQSLFFSNFAREKETSRQATSRRATRRQGTSNEGKQTSNEG